MKSLRLNKNQNQNNPLHQSLLNFSEDKSFSTLTFLTSPDEPTTVDTYSFNKKSLNISANILLENLPNLLTLYFLGQYSSTEIQATFGIVLMISICCGYGVFEGLATGLQTFIASIQSNLGIVIYQRTLVVCTFLMLPIVALLWLIQAIAFPFFLPGTAEIAGKMLLFSSISIYFNGLYRVSRSYTTTRQSFNSQQLITMLLTNLIHLLTCLFFFHYCQFTIYGAILAKTISDTFNLNLFLKLINISNEIKLEVFQSIKRSQLLPLLKKLVRNGKSFSVSMEAAVCLMFVLHIVGLGWTQVAGFVVGMSVCGVGSWIWTGAAAMSAWYAGRHLLNNKRLSIGYVKYGGALLVVWGIVWFLGLVLIPWQGVFSKDEDVISVLNTTTPFLIAFTVLSSIQSFISSLSRTLGEHLSSSKHYLISLIAGQALCFLLKSMTLVNGLNNIWISLIVSVLIYNLWQGILLLRLDLKESAIKIEDEIDEEDSRRESFIEVHFPEFMREHSTKSYQGKEQGKGKEIQMRQRGVSRTYSV